MPARHDQVDDPDLAARLLTARRGTAYFARKLAELSDDEFDQPSLLPGWTRAHVISHVGYNARALTRLLEWAATGVENPMYDSPEQRAREIREGATLTPIALRHLVSHSNVHLNVEWRDLPGHSWTNSVRTARGRTVPVSETAWMRAREVWVHAVDLNNGARFEDMPPAFLDDLLVDITGHWRTTGVGHELVLVPVDRADRLAVGDRPRHEVMGTAAELTAWATGRGVSWPDSPTIDPPPWL